MARVSGPFIYRCLLVANLLCSSVDIPLAEGPVNLNWGPIMKTINDNPYDFFQQGGWSFLGGTAVEEVCDLLLQICI